MIYSSRTSKDKIMFRNRLKEKLNPQERISMDEVNEMVNTSKKNESDKIPFRINHNTVVMISHDKCNDEFKRGLLSKYGK